MPAEEDGLNKKFRLEFSYNSNHLEGNTLTYGETKLLLFFGQTSGNHEKQELDEMQAHDVAWQLVQNWATDTDHTLSEKDIKELNEIILVRPFYKDAVTPEGQSTRRQIAIGSYKTQPNSVMLQNGEMFHYASPSETPIKMGELIEWFRSAEAAALHPIAQAALLHYKFVCIHPFDDGNGRISRLLMNYVLGRAGYPPVIIKSENKKEYLRALNRADAGDLNAFVDYIAECMLWSLQTSIKAAKGESIDEPGDFDKRVELLKRRTGNQGKVEMKYGREALEITLEHLIPLFEAWEEVMQKLDGFVLSRIARIKTNTEEFDNSNLTGILSQYRNTHKIYPLPTKIECNPTLQMESGPIGGGGMRLKFHGHRYDLEVGTLRKTYFYGANNPISVQDITEIIERLGNYTIAKIEDNPGTQ